MTPLSPNQYLSLRADAEVIEADGYGDKVLRLSDGTYLKLFRRKRMVSSALLYPYAKRFAANLSALRSRGIACPRVINIYRSAALNRDLVHYFPLEGRTLRQIIDPVERTGLRVCVAKFIAELHNKGIYFRSLHLGNVVLTNNGTFGLIDVADLNASQKPLGKQKRLRNFRHLFRYEADREWLLEDSNPIFLETYALHASPTINMGDLKFLLSAPHND